MHDKGYMISKDGTRLFFQINGVEDASKTFVIVHGFAEHSGRYTEITEQLNQAGYNVLSFDLRGHGRSRGTRGYIDSLAQYSEDLHVAICRATKTFGVKSVTLLAHSMGALIASHYATKYPAKLDAVIMSCPLFKIKVDVPKWKYKAAKLASTFTPKLALPNDLDPKYLSHNETEVKKYTEDPLVFKYVRARWFWEVIKSEAETLKKAKNFKIPLLLQIGSADRVVCPEQAKAWYNECGSKYKTMLVYENFYDDIYNEADKQRPVSDMISWAQST